jgi:ornithine cyclodeaminase/alanine dehydrogenase-like protein (mu-crystallin family)
MALLLTEDEVQALLPMERAIERVELSFRAQHAGRGINHPRRRIFLEKSSLHYMAAALADGNLVGLKIYTVTRNSFRFVVLLYDGETGELLALIEADHLGRLRTGAASGVATEFLARRSAARVGLIGAGRQARTQLEAVAKVRPVTAAKVFSRDEARRKEFCREMSARLGLGVEPVESAEAAARFGEIVITATTSREPVLRGEWLAPGAHVNAIGGNMANRRELDDAALARAALITVDSIEQAREEAGDLIHGLMGAGRRWDEVAELHEVMGGTRRGRAADHDITLFKSCGIALWDVAVAGFVYRQALADGRGTVLDLGRA